MDTTRRNKNRGTASIRIALPAVCLLAFVDTCFSQSTVEDSTVVQLDTVEVSGRLPRNPAASRTFSSHDVSTAPGSLNDPMRTLSLSAEVVSNSDLQAIPIVGGDEADGILTLMDGFPITYPYRLLGSFSLFNPLTTSRVELLTAGYPTTYGGYAPTAISVSSAADYSSRARLATDVSAFASSISAQVPISDTLRWSAKFAARASHIGLAAGLLPGPSRKRLEAFMPNLKDAQLFMSEMPSGNLYTFQEGLASQEHGSLVSSSRSFDYAWEKEFAGAAFITSSDFLTSEHRISWTHDNISLSTLVPIEYIGSGRFGTSSNFTTVRLQDQFQFPVLPALSVTAGTDLAYSISEVGLETFSSWLNGRSPLKSSFADISGFTEFSWAMTRNALVTVGVRGTYFGFIRQGGLEPRATLVYSVGDRSSVKLSLGQYLQSPSDFEILHGFLMFLSVPDQTPLMMLMSQYRGDLRPETHNLAALNAATTVVRNRSIAIDSRVDMYFKDTESLIMPERYPSVFTPLDTMAYKPVQRFRGVKWGMGLSSVVSLVPLDLSLSASLFTHHSRIVDGRTGASYLTVGDIPVVTKFLLQFSPRGWTVSLLYQYSTGSPTTDEYYLKGSNLVGDVVFLPVWRELNSDRVPDYHRLDFAVARSWHGANWKVDAVFGVLNLLGSQNISSYRYSLSDVGQDFVNKAAVINTLPFVPNIEIRCEYSL